MGTVSPEPSISFLLITIGLLEIGIVAEGSGWITFDLNVFVELSVGILGIIVFAVGLNGFGVSYNTIQFGNAVFNQ